MVLTRPSGRDIAGSNGLVRLLSDDVRFSDRVSICMPHWLAAVADTTDGRIEQRRRPGGDARQIPRSFEGNNLNRFGVFHRE